MNRSKQFFLFLFFLLAGVLLGSLLARVGERTPFLGWLAYGQTIGLSPEHPLVLDLAVIRLTFGFELSLNLGQVIGIFLSFLAGRKVAGKL